MTSQRPHVVIVGGGFAGLRAARALRRAPVDVTLLDRRNHHVFQPLLYQVATAGLAAPEIAAPLRRILRRQSNATVLMAEVVSVDLSRRVVVLADGEVPYDYLILATGATHSYFGHDAWARHAPGLKSIEDALEIRRRLFVAFERAEREADAAARNVWLTFLVVGGGPTGVELAGTLAEIARHTLAREFRRIDPSQARVVLVEGTDRVLPPYPPGLSQRARQQLEGLGVEVRTSALVTGVDEGGVWLGAERLAARTVLWAAGVAASPLGRSLGAAVDRVGRVKVEKDLTLAGRPEVFVVGDLAVVEQEGRPVPGVAPAAMQMGRHAGRNIRRALAGQPLLPFRYIDKGSLATIGRRAAVADFGRVRLWGFPAWMAWLGIHIFFLIGFRNRLVVLLDWAMAYVSYQRSARLILFEPQAASGAGFTPAERAGGQGGAAQHPPAQ
ncbi:MAG TPA: NAD(P)/FAD-dependent oxidoreductase [Vicinamibacteria bacterium]|nr:NAD(P)/FAD-dependent oxidoreductase [Vicinamibacteria bacterium]